MSTRSRIRDCVALLVSRLFWRLRWLESRGLLLSLNVGKGCTIAPSCFIDVPSELRLGDGVYVNSGTVMLAHGGIDIGDYTLIAPGVSLITANHDMAKLAGEFSETIIAKPIRIGRNCWICTGAIILPGVNIGDGAVIAAGAVVTSDVEDHSIVAGVPAKKIGMRKFTQQEVVACTHDFSNRN